MNDASGNIYICFNIFCSTETTRKCGKDKSFTNAKVECY